MAESYTTPHSLPILGVGDLVRSPSGDNIRKQINAVSQAANTAITAEGARAEGAAKDDATTKYGGLPDRVTSLEGQVWYKGYLPNGTDLNTFTDTGRWAVRLTEDVATIVNKPTGAGPGFVELTTTPHGMKVQTWVNYSSNTAWRRTSASVTAGTLTAWGAVDVDAKAYVDTKDAASRSAWAAADASGLSSAKAYTDTRENVIRDDLSVSNIDLDTDGIPFIRFGSRTAKILQDTDGAPYYEAA